jgi:sec-independent protein translocase protein TatA
VDLFAPGHLIPLLIVVAVLFFGWKQLPDMARSVGRSLRIFKTEMKGMGDDDATRNGQKGAQSDQAAVAPPPAATESQPVTAQTPKPDEQPPATG